MSSLIPTHKPSQLRCTGCGAQTAAPCNCGKPFDYIPAGEAAAKAVAAHPGKSPAVVSEKTGIPERTISRVMKKSSSPNGEVEKRTGRDGKTRKMPTKQKTQTNKAREAVRAAVQAGQPVSREKIAKDLGVSPATVQRATCVEEGRKEAEQEIRPEDLSKSAQQKLEIAIRQHRQRLESEYLQRVQAGVKQLIDEMVLPAFAEEQQDAKLIQESHKGIFTSDEYNKILRCLHPDLSPTVSDKNEAFHLWHTKKVVLLNQVEHGKQYSRLPTSDELMKHYNKHGGR